MDKLAGEKKLTFGLLLLSFALPLLAHAEPYVYWNNYNGATINRILGSGGSATTILSSLNTPFAVELDPVNNHLYYANGANLGIRRSNLDGSSPTDIVTGLGNIGVYGLALDTTNNYIYYANSNGGTLNRIAFNGVGGVQTLISGLGFPMSVALDVSGGKVYYTEFTGNKVSRANLDGSSPEVLLSATGYVGITLNVAAGKLYVATSSTVVQANLDGSSSTAILSSLSSPYGLGLDLVAQKLYVANNGGGGSIARSDLNGSNYEVIQTSAGNVFDLAVNGLIMEATPTPTPTHTSTATATATNTSTATATRTSTATRTPTATSTVTSTPTATLTATPTATSMATPTATVTPTITSSPVPTSTPTNTPTATPTVVAGMISGRLVDEFGNGVPNVVVYLSEILQNSAAKASDNTERRAGSTITDADGRYSFENLSTGNYRVEPDLQGFVFDPPEISVTEGANAPPIAAIPVQTNEETCDQTSVAAYIVKADRKVKELIDLANEEIAQLIQKSSHELQKSLTSAGSRLESGFDRILKLSTSLPKIVFECGGKEGCRSKKLKFIVKRYRLQMNEIRRIALFIARTAEIDSGTLDLARFRNSVRRNHARALQASKQLPRQTDVCESDPQS